MPFRPTPSKVLFAACIVATTAVAAGMTPVAQPLARADSDTPLFVWYQTKSDCLVYPNYPKPGVKGQMFKWTIEQGHSIIWRYNVNDTWAVVTDPARSKETFPWWGFTKRSCIGKSKDQTGYPEGIAVPSRIHEGRSHVASSGWRTVDYDQGPEAIVRHQVRVKHDGTLRDRVNFVVGNVFAGWKVDVTSLTRSNGFWVYVYSPSARKWGYVEAEKLDL
jgi:hypothetical protein